MTTGKMAGITPSGNHDYDMMLAAGVRWLRFGIGFPFREKQNAPHEQFLKRISQAQSLQAKGFGLLGSTGGPGSVRYDADRKETVWKPGMPSWAGTPADESYYRAFEDGCAEAARLAADTVALWQIANEPDIDIFRGPLTDAQIIRFLLAGARGVKKGNPRAQTGINIGELTPYARMLVEKTYLIANSPFDYIGLDGYFGSWQPGGPQNWVACIDDALALTGRPVIINEWGYSSLDRGEITDDPQRVKHYNQDVCKAKAWSKVWGSGHTPETQALFIAEALDIFHNHPHVRGDFFFKWSDDAACWQCGQPGCPAECAWGLVDVNGKPKPAYGAYAGKVSPSGADISYTEKRPVP